MNTWRARYQTWLLIIGVAAIHSVATESLSNTPEAMLFFYGSAALIDFVILRIVPALLSGRICNFTQWLLLASICGNAVGWILYMDYVPPSYYNRFMWLLTVAQWAVLLIPDRYADYPWFDLVRRRDHFGGYHYIREMQ